MKKEQQIEDLKRALNEERIQRMDAEARVRILRDEVKRLNRTIDIICGRVHHPIEDMSEITIVRNIS